ncbi:ATP-binding cassette domain-containing protein [Paenibacillus cremeus]|uniref:ATP-binding cassette domain-containing protein n=2 Tax=Paenibacillus cremeus TaxID=2163881 RepID=A0A559JDD5_9BACL|nr:ATP-binding cassette domain-containing protein [Paenibacillus cremeus]
MESIGKRLSIMGRSHLFQQLTAAIGSKERIALLGASGQGKSTLLRIVGQLDRPDEGELYLENRPSNQWKPQDWRSKVCYVAQQPIMLPGSVEDNLRTVSTLHRRPFEAELARALMAQCGLQDKAWQSNASELSGGEKQRVALVRSLLLRPRVLLLDEITSALDQNSKQAVEQLLREWHAAEETAMLWVTHDLQQARSVSDTVWFMAEGMLMERQPTELFFRQPITPAAQQFLQWPEEGVV